MNHGTDAGVGQTLADRINRLRAEYEAAWVHAVESGLPEPSVEEFLSRTPEPERPLLAQVLSAVDRAHKTKQGDSKPPEPAESIPDDFLPTMIGGPGKSEETVAPTNMMAVDRYAPTLAPTEAFDNATIAHMRAEARGGGDETVAPTAAFTRANFTNAGNDLGRTMPLDASGATIEVSEPEPPKKKGKGTREFPKIAGYEILGELGRGGMGVVYKARHKKLDRVVALKMVIAGAHASQDQLDRFILEAQAVARLQHPDIVQVFEIGEHDGLPFFSLEFVDGGTLASKIGGKPMPPKDAAEMTMILAAAMQFAHKRDIIHRDLKPANILLSGEGLPKITDFGLAKKLEDEESHNTRTGAIMGTPSYMAPEQAFGETDKIGPPADQYALGAMLYEMLTGRPPFQGATPYDTLDLVRNTEPVPPTKLQPKIPVDLETICLKAMQKEAAKRYADCEALARDLQNFLDGKPIAARPVSKTEMAWRWCRRNPIPAAAAAFVAAAIVAVTGVSTYAAVTIGEKNLKLESTNKQLGIAKGIAEKNEADAKAQRKIAVTKADEATKSAIEANRQKGIAQTNEAEARRQAVIANQQTMELLSGIKDMTSEIQFELRGKPAMQQLRMNLLGIAKKRAQNVWSQTADASVEKDIRAVALYQRMGNVLEEVGDYENAEKSYATATEIATDLAKANGGDMKFTHSIPSKLKNTVGDFVLNRRGNAAAAKTYYNQAFELRRELREHQKKLVADLTTAYEAAKTPEEKTRIEKEGTAAEVVLDAYTLDLAAEHGLLAGIELRLGRPDLAWDHYTEEIALRKSVRPEGRSDLQSRREMSGLEEKLGDVKRMMGQAKEGLEHYEKSLNMREIFATESLGDWIVQRDVGLSLERIGDYELLELNRPQEALNRYLKALELYNDLYQKDVRNIILKGDVAHAQYRAATAYLRLSKKQESDDLYEKSLILRRELAISPIAKLPEIDLIVTLARCGLHAEAAARMDAILTIPPVDNQIYFQAACAYALAAGAVGAGKPADARSEDEKTLARKYTDKAIEAMENLVKYEWKDFHTLRTDPDLDPIRDDPRFAPLLDQVKKALGPLAGG